MYARKRAQGLANIVATTSRFGSSAALSPRVLWPSVYACSTVDNEDGPLYRSLRGKENKSAIGHIDRRQLPIGRRARSTLLDIQQ